MHDDTVLLETLERYWGYGEFRPLQREAIAAILDRHDSVVVLPTGGGKSLCYQLPALLEDQGLVVVVSPLISLMKDQVDGLVGSGVPAAYLNSSLTVRQQGIVAQRLRQGAYRLLYVAPERLAGEGGRRFCALLQDCGLRYLAIDEAHCISQWGHDFRPEYRQLGSLREMFPDISVHAFTATATEQVRLDIADQLGLRQPRFLIGSFDRPNLIYRTLRRQQAAQQIRKVLARHPGEAGIVYCISRREVESLAARLRADGFDALPYHAGLAEATRRRHQEEFLNERTDIMVATVAFGMGIDRSNVRFVIHAGTPRSVEHYQQEAGRAGRDGLEAECLLLYSPGDLATWRRLLADRGEVSEADRRHLRDIERYATQTRCRHRALSEYFGQTYEKENCRACDWCLGELEAVAEPVVLAQKILSCVLRLRQRWGAGQVIDVLRGRTTEKVQSRGHDQLSTFGLLADVSVAELRGYLDQLVEQGWLALEGDRYPTLAMTPAGRLLLRAEVSCELFRYRQPPRQEKAGRSSTDSWEGVDHGLFERLRELRRDIAGERGQPPYVIFHDSVLRHLARSRPIRRETLLRVPGVGERKAEDLGESFLSVIASYCAAHGLSADLLPTVDAASARQRQQAAPPSSATRQRAWELYAEGAQPEEVAQATGRALSTVRGYLVEYVRGERPASVEPWLTAETLERIRQARRDEALAGARLKPLYEHFGGEIDYWQLRIALSFLATAPATTVDATSELL